MVDCTWAFYPPAILQVLPLPRAAPSKLALVCSSQRVLPIEELQLSDGGDGDPSEAVLDHCDFLKMGMEWLALVTPSVRRCSRRGLEE